MLRGADARSFGTLENALRFLAAHEGSCVYPPPGGSEAPRRPRAKVEGRRRR